MASHINYQDLAMEKDLESSGLVVGRKRGIHERVYVLCKKFSGSLLVTIVLLIFLAVSCFKPRVVYVYNYRPGTLGPFDEGDAASWTLKGWDTDKCAGAAPVNVEGADDQKCTATPSSNSTLFDEDGDAPIELEAVTWTGENSYALCLYADAGCASPLARYVGDVNCSDGHDATYYAIVASKDPCPSNSTK